MQGAGRLPDRTADSPLCNANRTHSLISISLRPDWAGAGKLRRHEPQATFGPAPDPVSSNQAPSRLQRPRPSRQQPPALRPAGGAGKGRARQPPVAPPACRAPRPCMYLSVQCGFGLRGMPAFLLGSDPRRPAARRVSPRRPLGLSQGWAPRASAFHSGLASVLRPHRCQTPSLSLPQ